MLWRFIAWKSKLSHPLPYLLMILRFGKRREHALGHRLEADDGGVAVGEERDQFVLAETVAAVVKLGGGIGVEHLLPHCRMAVDVIGDDTEAV